MKTVETPANAPKKTARPGGGGAFPLIVLAVVGLVVVLPWLPRTKQTRKPLSGAEAAERFSISLPEGAENVLYKSWSFGPGRAKWLKCNASPQSASAYAERNAPFDADVVISPSHKPHFHMSDAPEWFDVGNIRNGRMMKSSWRLTYWIDEDRQLLYHLHTD